jgi:hypothetical protein
MLPSFELRFESTPSRSCFCWRVSHILLTAVLLTYRGVDEIDRRDVKFLGNLSLMLWDCGGSVCSFSLSLSLSASSDDRSAVLFSSGELVFSSFGIRVGFRFRVSIYFFALLCSLFTNYNYLLCLNQWGGVLDLFFFFCFCFFFFFFVRCGFLFVLLCILLSCRQTAFLEEYFNQKETIFRNVALLIYVFDVQSSNRKVWFCFSSSSFFFFLLLLLLLLFFLNYWLLCCASRLCSSSTFTVVACRSNLLFDSPFSLSLLFVDGRGLFPPYHRSLARLLPVSQGVLSDSQSGSSDRGSIQHGMMKFLFMLFYVCCCYCCYVCLCVTI